MGRTEVCQSPPPGTLDQEHLRLLRTLHEAVAGDFGKALAALLRSPVEVSLVGVDQLSYGEFVGGLEAPSCFSLLRAQPLGDCLLLDIELSILYPLIDRMLGGGDQEPPPRRALSEIELPLAARIVRLFLQKLRHAWKRVADLKLEAAQTESNPRLLRALPADEMVVPVGFRVTLGNRQGMVRLVFPCRTVVSLGDKLTAGGGPGRQPTARESGSESGEFAELSVTLATTTIDTGDLAGLGVGDIIASETTVDSPALISVAGEPKFRARPGACQGRKAVRIVAAVESPSRASR